MLSGPDLVGISKAHQESADGFQITYISVPLTLTGVVQIYILCKAIWIYYKLYRSIPNELRSFYSFYPDPSSGTVLVIAPTIVCTNPGLWQETTPPKFYQMDTQKFRHGGFWKLWGRRKKDEPVLPTVQDWDEKKLNRCHLMPSWMTSQTKISLEPRRFHVSEPKDLFRPWMETATTLGFRLNQAKDLTHGEFHKWAKDTRITVGIDMGITPQKVVMPWKIFVWFALAIGTNPFDLDPRMERYKFKHITKHEVLMRLSRVGDDWNFALDTDQYYEYSVRRALALVNFMCFERKGAVVGRFLGSPDEFKLTPDFFRRPDHFTTQTTPATARLQSAALTWIFYKEHLAGQPLYKFGSELLVCQWMLEAQQRSLLFLYELDREGILESTLHEVFHEHSGEESSSSARELLKILRHDFQSSSYPRQSCEFLCVVRQLVQRLKSFQLQSSAESSASSTANGIQQLLSKWDQPLEPPRRSAAAQPGIAAAAELQSEVRQVSTRRMLLSEMARCGRFVELRDRYDAHKREGCAVENEPLPAGDLALLAHVYLAMQPWQHHHRMVWGLSPSIRDPLQTLQADGDDKTMESDIDNSIATLEQVAQDAQSGIYSAPWERDMVYNLLQSEDVPQVVFLV